MSFKFYYEIGDNITYDKDLEMSVNRQSWKEKEYFERYGKILDKSSIPKGRYCNDENMSCPYCVSDCCLLYGGRMESKLGYYGFSFQKRKKQCTDDYPKGKNMEQIEMPGKNDFEE